jgi:hypothetical protein
MQNLIMYNSSLNVLNIMHWWSFRQSWHFRVSQDITFWKVDTCKIININPIFISMHEWLVWNLPRFMRYMWIQLQSFSFYHAPLSCVVSSDLYFYALIFYYEKRHGFSIFLECDHTSQVIQFLKFFGIFMPKWLHNDPFPKQG